MHNALVVIAGLVPATPITVARPCPDKRGGRVKPGHDDFLAITITARA
jgi:hypothetical protein